MAKSLIVKVLLSGMESLDKEQIWQIVLSELELVISRTNFKTWFQNTYIACLEDNGETAVVAVPNNFSREWLEKRYHKSILTALQNASDNKIKKVIYKVETKASGKVVAPVSIGLETKAKEVEVKSNGYGLNPHYTFETFVVGQGSELAHAAALAVAKEPVKRYNPLFIYGGVGLGKTHLLQAIGHYLLKNNPEKKVRYTNAEKFTNEFIEAVRKGTVDKFRKFYRNLDVLLIDDIQFMAGKERTQEEFFHTFNSLHQEERQIVITSDRPPKSLPALEERLISRLEWGLIADITPPDLETRLAILKTKCQERNCALSDEILQYLAAHIQNNVRELEGALNKIIAYQNLQRTTIDLNIVKNIITNLAAQPKKGLVQTKQIVESVANFYGVKVSDMISASRRRELVTPRQVVMYLMREEINASFPLIGKELGNRDHTTAMHAYGKIKKEIDEGGRIKQEVDLIKQRLYNK